MIEDREFVALESLLAVVVYPGFGIAFGHATQDRCDACADLRNRHPRIRVGPGQRYSGKSDGDWAMRWSRCLAKLILAIIPFACSIRDWSFPCYQSIDKKTVLAKRLKSLIDKLSSTVGLRGEPW